MNPGSLRSSECSIILLNKYIRGVSVSRPGAAPAKTGVFAERCSEHYAQRGNCIQGAESFTVDTKVTSRKYSLD